MYDGTELRGKNHYLFLLCILTLPRKLDVNDGQTNNWSKLTGDDAV